MKESLQRKVNLLAQNSKIVRKSAKMDFAQAANLGALLFTNENLIASERDIRANRKILKQNTSVFSNMRGSAVNLTLLTRMCLKPNPEAYLRNVMSAYECVKQPKVFKGQSLVFTAINMAENTEPDQYQQASWAAWSTLEKMRQAHPLLTGDEDLTLAHLLNLSGMDINAMLSEAEEIYEILKPTGFKLKKNTLQSISIILAMSDKPVDEKCQKFMTLREALKQGGQRMYGEELAIVAAFADTDKPNDEIVKDVADAAAALKHVYGFGMFAGANLRRMYSAALVLQTYGEEMQKQYKLGAGVAENVVNAIIFDIIMTIIMIEIVAMISASSASSASA